MLDRANRLKNHFWDYAGQDPDQPSDEQQWACSFANELQELIGNKRVTKSTPRIRNLERIALEQFGYNPPESLKRRRKSS